MEFASIHTLNARDNIVFDVCRHISRPTANQWHKLIRRDFDAFKRLLLQAQIDYQSLRRCLTPQIDRMETAFLFDYSMAKKSHYGNEFWMMIAGFLDQKSNNAVLVGDLIGGGERLSAALHDIGRILGRMPPSTIYVIYLNNLTESQSESISKSLVKHPEFIGSVDATRHSAFKDAASECLVHAYLKVGRKMVCKSPDVVSTISSSNMPGLTLEAFGFTSVAVPDIPGMMFLDYKIERRSKLDDRMDRNYSYLAILPRDEPIELLQVHIDDAKHDYLRREKIGSLERAGLSTCSAEVLARLIRDRLCLSYIYDLGLSSDGTVTKFAVLAELDNGSRFLCALKQSIDDPVLRVVTLY